MSRYPFFLQVKFPVGIRFLSIFVYGFYDNTVLKWLMKMNF